VENRKITGTELSGGIDSSSVTALASRFSKIKTFSHILPDSKLGKMFPHKDEREFIQMLTEHCNISDKHFVTSEVSLLDTLQDHVEYYQSLSQQNFGVFSDQLYVKAQQEKVTVLLSGFGGDEVVTSQASGYLYELAQNKKWQVIKIDLKNRYPRKSSYNKALLKLYIKLKLPGFYSFLRILKPDKPWWRNKYKNLALNADYEKKLGVKKRYEEYYQNIARETLQDKNIERITHPHVSQRLEYCSLIARKYGIEYRYPLLDIRLIEFYLSIPPRLKARNGIGRYLIRRAMEGILPEKIQWRNDKSGATIPTVFMRLIQDKDQFEHLINSAKQNEIIKKYIDLNKYEQWFYNLSNRTKDDKFVNPGAFYTYIKLILFIKKNPSLFT
jgi:asparagine synthase (glutamine-hydrolysing)